MLKWRYRNEGCELPFWFFPLLSIYFYSTWFVEKYTGKITYIIILYLFILHLMYWIPSCQHANRILSKLPAPHNRLSRPDLVEELCPELYRFVWTLNLRLRTEHDQSTATNTLVVEQSPQVTSCRPRISNGCCVSSIARAVGVAVVRNMNWARRLPTRGCWSLLFWGRSTDTKDYRIPACLQVYHGISLWPVKVKTTCGLSTMSNLANMCN